MLLHYNCAILFHKLKLTAFTLLEIFSELNQPPFTFQDVNQKWQEVQQITTERANQLGSAHEVQRFQRDVDETKDWIREKDDNLNSDICGDDLRSVQTLQRKHEGLERDLAALGDRVNNFFNFT